MRVFSDHPRFSGGERGFVPGRREALRLRLVLYCERHIRNHLAPAPARLDRRFTAFFTAARRQGYIGAAADPATLAHLFIALLAGLDLRRCGGALPHDLRRMAAEMIRLIIAD